MAEKQYRTGYVIFLIMICFVVAYALQSRNRMSTAPRATYTTVNEVLSDKPFRTLIKKYIVVSGIPSKTELESKLNDTYQAILADARGGHYYHEVPDVFIGIYGTKEQAEAGNLWIGMLGKSVLEKTLDIRINETRLAALSQKPEGRFGLSEQRREDLFRAIASAQDRAECIALERFPSWQSAGPNQPERMITEQGILVRLDLQQELEKQYMVEVAQLYDLTMERLKQLGPEINMEAYEKGWVPPPYPCE